MKRLLIQKEVLALLRDARVLTLALAVAALFAAVFTGSTRDAERARTERHEAEAAARMQWDTQGDKHPHRGAHFGIHVFAPVSPLSAFDPGVGRHLGQALWLEPHKRNMTRFSDVLDDPASARFGDFTPAFVLHTILPLLIVAAAFGAVVQERESGTLRMLYGTAARPGHVVWSKFAALFTGTALLVVCAFAIVLLPAAGQTEAADLLLRGILLCLVYLLYYAVIIGLALAVSARAKSSRQALMTLVAIWLVFAFVVPRAGAAAASAAVPLPSAESFWGAIHHDYQHGLPGDGDLATRGKRYDESLLRKYGVTKLEDLPVGGYALRRLHRDAYADKVHALHFNALWERLMQQESVLRASAAFSPTVAMRLASMALAGTDLAHRRHFEEAAERYRQRFNTQVDEWDAANSTGLRSFEDKYAGNAVWQSVNRFAYRPPSVARALHAVWRDILILAAWAAAALALLIISARSLRP